MRIDLAHADCYGQLRDRGSWAVSLCLKFPEPQMGKGYGRVT